MDNLYDADTVAWCEQQGALLRRVAAGERLNTAPDWINIAEEIESLGRSQARELSSRIAIIMLHLMKLEASPSADPRPGWRETVRRERDEVSQLLDDAPSLRARVPSIIAGKVERVRQQATASLADRGETQVREIANLAYAEPQILGDWLPQHDRVSVKTS